MLNNQTTRAAKPQKQIIQSLLGVTVVYLSLSAVPMQVMAQLAAPLPVGAPSAIAVISSEPKLAFKAGGSNLTVEELEQAQKKKLEEDFFKKAGYTSVAPVVVKPIKTSMTVGAGAMAVAKPVNTLFVAGVYGTQANQKAEVSWNGVVSIIEAGASFGKIVVESVQAGQVTVAYVGKSAAVAKKKGKKQAIAPATSVRQTLKAGEILEIPA